MLFMIVKLIQNVNMIMSEQRKLKNFKISNVYNQISM